MVSHDDVEASLKEAKKRAVSRFPLRQRCCCFVFRGATLPSVCPPSALRSAPDLTQISLFSSFVNNDYKKAVNFNYSILGIILFYLREHPVGVFNQLVVVQFLPVFLPLQKLSLDF